MSKPTQTPWEYRNRIIGVDAGGGDRLVIAKMSNDSFADANAAHIVKCVNMHDEFLHSIRTAALYLISTGIDRKENEHEPEYQMLRDFKQLLAKAEAE